MMGGLEYLNNKDIEFSQQILNLLFKKQIILNNERALGYVFIIIWEILLN